MTPATEHRTEVATAALYVGTIRHRRHVPTPHAFTRPLYLAWIDADRPQEALGGLEPLAAAERRRPVAFHRADHLRPLHLELGDAVRFHVAEQTGVHHTGPIRMLANLRTFGYCFNPISLYWCFDADGTPAWIVAEVTNIPWGERIVYVCPADAVGGDDGHRFDKHLHVSPFFDMDHTYRLRATDPGPRLWVRLENEQDRDGEPTRVFDADLVLQRRPLDRRGLAAAVGRQPFITARTAAAIHWQALRLWRKGVPYVPHPDRHPDPESAPKQRHRPDPRR